MKGIILAGGEGTRLLPLTKITNKHLLPVYNKPMILFPLETLTSFGIGDILIVTGGEHIGKFADFLGDGTEYNVRLTYKVQNSAGGIAEALSLAEDFSGGGRIVVILGDNIYDNANLVNPKDTPKDHAVIYGKSVEDPERFGVISYKNNKVSGIEEKPKRPKSNVAVTGLYVYPNNVFDVIKTLKPSARGELEITDVNNYYIKTNRMRVENVSGFWSDAGTFDSLLKSSNRAKEL